jgi:transposase InsO family protein
VFCLLPLGLRQDHVVVVPDEMLVMCHMAKDHVTEALVHTSQVDHNFLLVVIASLRNYGCLVFSLTLFLGKCHSTGILHSLLTPVLAICSPRVLLLMQDGGLENTWLMDSGCSRHMTESSKWFSSLDPVIGKKYITFGDKSRGKVVSHGTIRVNESFILKDVALVLNLHFNLLPVLQLLKDDYEVRFKKGLSQVLDARGDLICQISPFVRVFSADFSHSSSSSRCLLAGSSSSLWKWHRRLGHLSFDLLCHLSSLDLIQGLPKLKFEKDLVYHPCHHGKMIVASNSPVTKVMTSHPGELLHMDTVGPARVCSFGGKWYVLVVVDDFCRYSWVFFMTAKDEAFTHARDLILRLQNEFPKNAMRAIHSDNGIEFENTQFATFCASLGLEHQLSSPYVPQQNGIVERKNRTLVEMVKTMLDEHRNPMRFWAEAINTACNVSNRIFLRTFLSKTSYELRFGRPPKVSHFRVFGYRCAETG